VGQTRPGRSSAFRLAAAAVAASLYLAPPAAAQQGDVARVHDPCIIKQKDTYYVFSTGPGIPVRRSADLFKWESAGRVFAETPAWVKEAVPGARSLWAPDISFFNGKYHLYYSASTFGKNRSCIGLATNATLDPDAADYKWSDEGKVLESVPDQDDWNAIDPNVVLDADGEPWLAFGSFWGGVKLRRLDKETGKPSAKDTKLYALARRPSPGAVEAPFIIRHGEYYYLFVSFDSCCRGADSTYRIMVGRSKELAGPYEDRDGKAMAEGGGTLILAGHGRCRGPGHNAVLSEGKKDWLVHHFYDADDRGVAKLQVRPLVWGDDGWPLPGEPLEGPAPEAGDAAKGGLAGEWDYSVDFGPAERVAFQEGGRLKRKDGAGAWSVEGPALLLRWPRTDDAPERVVKCVLSEGGRWFVGRDAQGAIVRGRRIKD